MRKILALALALCLSLSLAACVGDGPQTGSSGKGEDVLYQVTVVTSAGIVPSDIKYYVYRDESRQTGILAYGKLENSGNISFTAPASDSYTLVLEDVQEGYTVQPSYTLKDAKTELVLNSGVVKDQQPTEKVYELGDFLRDFTVTDTDGVSHTISQLLETKKCVVLNFWNIKCDPCKAEFPHLQRAYEAYKDDIALIAMDPVPTDTENDIRALKEWLNLTFPMAPCPKEWVMAMAPGGNPTTVIIDRYGRICVKQTGSMPAGVFETVFEHFVADDYKQILIPDMQKYVQEQGRK